MTKQIIFEDPGRWSPTAGVDALANVVKAALDRKGRIALTTAILIVAVLTGILSALDVREALS